jgi:iron-sulfur cluster repair protein YtfE (RIC family)
MGETFKDNESPSITADMTILDIVSRYRQTEAVFKEYDKKAGACLCCQALFDCLKEVANKYGLDLNHLLADLEMIAREAKRSKDIALEEP